MLIGGALLLMADGCARSRRACTDVSCRGRTEDAGPSAMPRDDAGSRADAGAVPDDAAGQGGSAPSAMAGTDGTQAGAGGAAGADPGCGPWYRCIDVCRAPQLAGGGRSIGQCTGDRRYELEFAPAYYFGKRDCIQMSVKLVVRDSRGGSRPILAALTEQAWERLALIARALEADTSDSAGECPECSAGDEAWLALERSRAPVRYPRGNPPPLLREADTFVQALIDQLAACSGDLIAQCAVDSSACQVHLHQYAARDAARLHGLAGRCIPWCTTALRCLCGGDVLPEQAEPSIDACVERWLGLRGAPTLADLCASSAPSATHALVEAITVFGNMHGGSVTMNAGLCSMIPAFY